MKFTHECKIKCVQLKDQVHGFLEMWALRKGQELLFFLLCHEGLFSLLQCLFSVKLAVKYKIYYSNI